MNFFKVNDKVTSPLTIVTLIGICVMMVRFLLWADRFHSALLYIAVPFSLSLALYYFTPQTDGSTWRKRFWNNFRYAFIIILAASLILMEGYVCVVMSMPIFFFFTAVAFMACYIWRRSKGTLNAYALPAIVMLMSLEGVTDVTTFNRYNEVSYSQVIQSDIETIRQRLTQPVTLQGERHWILSLVPMPRYVGSVRLDEGDVRRYDFVYHRWFVANTHAGSVDVTLTEVGDDHIKTKIDDSSYISGYLKLHGTEVTFFPVDETQTRVTLTVAFDRLLDPLWYFEPLERFAVRKGAQYLVNELLGKEGAVDTLLQEKGEA